jgi:hypothetical protein
VCLEVQDRWLVHVLAFYQAALNTAANAVAASGAVATYANEGSGTFQPSRSACRLLTAPAAWWLLSLPLAHHGQRRVYVLGLLVAMLLASSIASMPQLSWTYRALWLALSAAPLPELLHHAWCVPSSRAAP